MWNVNTDVMCNKHLLGEHVEMHMFTGSINKGINMQGYLDKGLVEIHNINKRHKELVKEMKKRGMIHNSPLNFICNNEIGYVDSIYNLQELNYRCEECRRLQNVSN